MQRQPALGLVVLLLVPIVGTQQAKTIRSRVVVETVYDFDETIYARPKLVQLVTERALASQATPEATAIAGLSAMAAGDYDWNLSLYDEQSRREIERRAELLRERGVDKKPAEIFQSYKQMFESGAKAYLAARADTPDFSLVAVEIDRGNKKLFEGTVAMVKTGKAWTVTSKYRSHPVKQLWRSGAKKLTVVHKWKSSKKTERKVR